MSQQAQTIIVGTVAEGRAEFEREDCPDLSYQWEDSRVVVTYENSIAVFIIDNITQFHAVFAEE